MKQYSTGGERPERTNRGLSRLWSATRCSVKGFRSAWVNEEAFRLEVCLLIPAVPCAFWLGRSLLEQLCLIAVLMLLLIVELLNTAVEITIDRISSENHPLSGMAKDVASAAVMLAILLAAGVWIAIAIARWS